MNRLTTLKKLAAYFVQKRQNIRLVSKGIKVGIASWINVDRLSRLTLSAGCRIIGGRIQLGANSSIVVGKGAVLKGRIIVGEGCSVELGDNFSLLDADIFVDKSGKLVIDKDSSISSILPYKAMIRVLGGTATLGVNTRISGDVLVEDACFNLGSNSFINPGSEIRCAYGVDIGEYVFISYFVDIFDNNTHSTNWQDRRMEILKGYPGRTVRSEQKPNGKPIYLGNDVWVGKGATILKGCKIGDRSIVGMHSVVTSMSCNEDSIVVGNPASVRKQIAYN